MASLARFKLGTKNVATFFIYTECISCEPHCFRADFRIIFNHKSMGAINLQGIATFGPSGLIDMIYVGNY